ncbi:MAG: DNA-directed RNA polymerase subunit alpha [Patescibacteria group bacterium]|nr:DNA-directed RNA polymerase subunit alpha [Patescibacteria group bacterium]
MLKPNFFTQKIEENNYGKFIIEPLPLSFANSLGNALRRTLLSSLRGAAVTQVKIEGVSHIFSTIKGVKESVLEIIMNIKQLKFKTSENQEKFKIYLNAKGSKKIYAKNFEGELKPINEELYICEITDDKTSLLIEAIVEVGYGYITADEREDKETGFIAVDAFFSPIRKVNTKIEEARVGRKANFERLIIEIWTDGSIDPSDALRQSSRLLSEYFSYLLSKKDTPLSESDKNKEQINKENIDKKLYEIIIDELNLPSRVINALLKEKIETVADLVKVGREKLIKMKGVGKKSIELIDEELKKMNIQI